MGVTCDSEFSSTATMLSGVAESLVRGEYLVVVADVGQEHFVLGAIRLADLELKEQEQKSTASLYAEIQPILID
jgi:hypothetical protein